MTGDFQALLLTLIRRKRPDDGCVDIMKAKRDTTTLRNFMKKPIIK